MMTDEELLIHQLAERAGVSVRTIRYYIEEGLLPEPKYQGKYSYYTLTYLHRLELIRRLKDSYLPLKEIREIMNSLTDEEVKRRLKESPQSSPKFTPQTKPPEPRAKPGARALDYINRVMEDQSKYRTKGTQDKNQPNDVDIKELRITPPANSPRRPTEERPEFRIHLSSILEDQAASGSQAETWQRISLAPGVELHLHKPLDPDTENKVQQLLFIVKRIFKQHPKEG